MIIEGEIVMVMNLAWSSRLGDAREGNCLFVYPLFCLHIYSTCNGYM